MPTDDKIQGVRQINAELRYYMHVPDPDSLSDEEWAMAYNDLIWIRKREMEANK